MSELNPYASPQTAADAQIVGQPMPGAWRHGDYLILHRLGALPAACIFTGATSDLEPLGMTFIGPGDRYTLWIVIQRYDATAYFPVTRDVRSQYGWMGFWHNAGVYGGIALMVAAITCLTQGLPIWGAFCGIAGLLAFTAAAWANFHQPKLTLYDIDSTYLWLRGASPEFLKLLPEWPGEPR